MISSQGPNRQHLKRRAERAIHKLNTYEKKWKIRTNRDKFTLVSVSKTKPPILEIDGQQLEYSNSATILGLNIRRTGIGRHIATRTAMARGAYNKLKRFRSLNIKTKLHLYKAYVRSTLEYPAPLLSLTSKTNKLQLQRIQNYCIKDITKTNPEDRDLNIRQLHEKYEMEALNIRLHNRTKKCWDKLSEIQPDLCNTSLELNELPFGEHSWWPRLGKYISMEDPEPIYVKEINRPHEDESDSESEVDEESSNTEDNEDE